MSRELDSTLRNELVNLLADVPALQEYKGREAWLANLPRKVRSQISRRDEHHCKNDLTFIIDAVQTLKLQDTGEWVVLRLIDVLLPELQAVTLGNRLQSLRAKIERSLKRNEHREAGLGKAPPEVDIPPGKAPTPSTSDPRRQEWMKQLGFKLDPFLYTDGGTDPYLREYFYFGMRHFYHIQGDVSRPGTVFVFGPPGSGKSSLRNVIAQLCHKDGILPVVYWSFGSLVRKCEKGEGVQVKDHVTQILKTAIGTLAEELEKESEEERKEATSLQETRQAKIARNQLWLYVSRDEDDPFRKQTLEDCLKPDKEPLGALPTDDRELLGRFCQCVTELFRYQFVYILIDPDDDIAPNEDIAWQVLEPLLSTRRLLEPSEYNVAFKLFLGQKFLGRTLRIPWINHEQSKSVYELRWPNDELGALLGERLSSCSEGRYQSLEQLSEVDGLDDRVIQLSEGTPRELVAMCNRLFSEHCRRWSPENGEPFLITAPEADAVLAPFAERHKESALGQLIAQGESSRLEFKSTMRYNRKAGRPEKEMEREIARTLCGFLNTEGGTLIIGVDDDGMALGLDDDFSTLGRRRNRDGFEQAFANIMKNLLVPSVLQKYYTARFEEYQGKSIYIVEVERSEEPVFCVFDGVRELYIRELNTTRKLDAKDTWEYCSRHFGQTHSSNSTD